MRVSPVAFRRGLSVYAVCAVAACLLGSGLGGCSEDPGLQERLTRMQAEMQEKTRALQETEVTLEKTKAELKSALSSRSRSSSSNTPASAGNGPQFLPKEQLEESYAAASKAMQTRLESELRGGSIENCTMYPVVMPTSANPYSSLIALTVRAENGHLYQLEFPVSADTRGRWAFPTATEVSGALVAQNRQQDESRVASNTSVPVTPTSTPRSATPARPTNSIQTIPQLVPGQAATETRTVDWGDNRSTKRPSARPDAPGTDSAPSPARQPQPTAIATPAQLPVQPPQGQPQQPASSRAPQQAMPSNQDVTIHW